MNRRFVLTLAALAMPATGFAQGSHSSHAPGPHGGLIGEAGSRHVELVTAAGEVRIYVLGPNDQPASASGASGSVVIQAQGRQQTLRLEPAEADTYLVARSDFPARGLRVVATLTLPGQPQRSVRFPAIP